MLKIKRVLKQLTSAKMGKLTIRNDILQKRPILWFAFSNSPSKNPNNHFVSFPEQGIELADGFLIEGELVQGVPCGFGKLKLRNGQTVEGEFMEVKNYEKDMTSHKSRVITNDNKQIIGDFSLRNPKFIIIVYLSLSLIIISLIFFAF